jgi:hypothetical protein
VENCIAIRKQPKKAEVDRPNPIHEAILRKVKEAVSDRIGPGAIFASKLKGVFEISFGLFWITKPSDADNLD